MAGSALPSNVTANKKIGFMKPNGEFQTFAGLCRKPPLGLDPTRADVESLLGHAIRQTAPSGAD